MKKLFKATFAIALTSMLLFSCSKAEKTIIPDEDNLLKVTIIAGNPQVDPGTKTEIQGTTPYWSIGDAIGVSDGTTSNNEFTTSIESASSTATFTGHTVSGTLYAYYPYSSNGVGEVSGSTGAKVDIPANQNPTATSFDGSADVMVAKSFVIDPQNTTVSGLRFKRLGAVVKIVLKDNTAKHVLADQHPSVISLQTSGESDVLAGRQIVDMVNQSLGEIYHNGTNKVTANYTSSTHFLINSTNAAYFVVHPRNLAAGTTLTVSASTEGYTIEKAITVPSGGINLEAGKITTLNIGLSDSQVIASSGAALPFIDDFSWQSKNGEQGLVAKDFESTRYSAFDKCYQGKVAGTLRIGTSSATGYLTTEELDLSGAFHVIVSAHAYNASDDSKIQVVVDGETIKTADKAMTSTTTSSDYIFNFDAATSKSKVKITTDQKRAVLTNVKILSGTYVFSPVINVTSSNPMSVENTASSKTISYTIDNPTSASLTATTTASWISNIDCSTSGSVTFDVAAQESGAASRSGVITLSYNGAEDVEVTVNQAAAAGAVVTYQHIFKAKPSTGSSINLSGINWSIEATNLGSYNNQNYAGVQIGSKNNDGSITLTSSSNWSYQSKTQIKEVRLWLNLGGTSVTPSVTIGGKNATSDGTTVVKNSNAGSDWTKATKVTFTPVSDGNTGVVVINVATVKAGYICAVEIDCE